MTNDVTRDLLSFVESSPTPYHAVQSARTRLGAAGFQLLDEREDWNELDAGRYVIDRGDGVLLALVVPEAPVRAFRIVGAHTDSPNLRLKAATAKSGYVKEGLPAARRRGVRRRAPQLVARSRSRARRSRAGAPWRRGAALAGAARRSAPAGAAARHPPRSGREREGPGAGTSRSTWRRSSAWRLAARSISRRARRREARGAGEGHRGPPSGCSSTRSPPRSAARTRS